MHQACSSTDPEQVLDNLIKDVMNKQGQFIRKVIGTYSKLSLPWNSDGRCQTKSNDHQGAWTLNPD
jgi:hypothetical protein